MEGERPILFAEWEGSCRRDKPVGGNVRGRDNGKRDLKRERKKRVY